VTPLLVRVHRGLDGSSHFEDAIYCPYGSDAQAMRRAVKRDAPQHTGIDKKGG